MRHVQIFFTGLAVFMVALLKVTLFIPIAPFYVIYLIGLEERTQ